MRGLCSAPGSLAQELFERYKAACMHHLQHAELKMEPRLLSIPKLIMRAKNNVEKAREVFLGKHCGYTGDLLPFIGRDVQ